ncbi:MAG: substrate-binding domain-containing protein [Methylococcales bacterium]|nr:substrate-binding domain-containing protein [Methylococcales bacterium]
MKKIGLLLFLFITLPLQANNVLRLSTTTSTENSGLLAVLNPVFEKKYKARVDVIAVGTGKALKLGENGDVDVVFVHAPVAEKKFINAGYGVDRHAVMHNDFVLIGAKSDKADVKSSKTISEALQKIITQNAVFISRGDDSGTHKKEKSLWALTQKKPQGAWYVSVGQGMGAVLKIADEKQAYTLTDRGTYIAYKDKLALDIVFAGGKNLFNPYHIMAVNPKRYQSVNYELAKKYIGFIVSIEGQKIIADYQKKGQPLFYPDAIK